MKKQYMVFSSHHLPTTVQATLADGATVEAQVDSLEVQLVPADPAGGTVKIVYTDPEQIAAVEAGFPVGASVEATFAIVG